MQAGERVGLGAVPHGTVDFRVLDGDGCLTGEEPRQFELARTEVRFGSAHPSDVESARDLAANQERDDDEAFGLFWSSRNRGDAAVEKDAAAGHRPGNWSFRRVDVPVRVHGDAFTGRALEAIARDQGSHHARAAIDAVDREIVIRKDLLQRVGD